MIEERLTSYKLDKQSTKRETQPSALDVREAFARKGMDDMVLAHGSGSFFSRSALEPLELVERSSTEHIEALKEVAQYETQQVQSK